jgi:hypothetical protein
MKEPPVVKSASRACLDLVLRALEAPGHGLELEDPGVQVPIAKLALLQSALVDSVLPLGCIHRFTPFSLSVIDIVPCDLAEGHEYGIFISLQLA